jgi:hypothetical protein
VDLWLVITVMSWRDDLKGDWRSCGEKMGDDEKAVVEDLRETLKDEIYKSVFCYEYTHLSHFMLYFPLFCILSDISYSKLNIYLSFAPFPNKISISK